MNDESDDAMRTKIGHCVTRSTSEGRADWCPAKNQNIHSYYDYGTWVEHRHPQCRECGYVDESRELTNDRIG